MVIEPKLVKPGKSRAAKRIAVIESRRRMAIEAARLQEEKDEAVSPKAQRNELFRRGIVNGCDTQIIMRGPRVVRDGHEFRRNNPIRTLVLRGKLLTKEHELASVRLQAAYDEGMGGIGLGASDYESSEVRGGQVGGEGRHRALMEQIRSREECQGALKICDMDGILLHVVINGLTVKSWAERSDMNDKMAMGVLWASLVRLVRFYDEVDNVPKVRRKRVSSGHGRGAVWE